ncbi:sulfatase-modifying factor protein [Candidatus Thiomargarita nelsonii]|uniref:Sulfatase-modifying factor protein n=1 Tax=Candidatus Thiomargarita nelsonii TaxID=1003181 RepID=A0A4E0QQQ6_9GAMM|nr:sulfatase-modifying factor protein [Candidatus Thiomargarita nelsonii]
MERPSSVEVLRQLEEIADNQNAASYNTENLPNGVILESVSIPGGTFMMGSPETEKGRSDNENQHEVTISPFYMAKYQVTQAQWQAVMGRNEPSRFKGDNRPVEQVSWDEAVAFCKKLSTMTGKNYRLPTEAEWEYACRAGTTTPFYFGETITTDLVNYDGNYPYGDAPKGVYREKTTEVGSFPPNAFGIYDMHGNVWEWCADIYSSDYYKSSPPRNPTGPSTGRWYRVLRGGAWSHYARGARAAIRGYDPRAKWRHDYVGFRLVRQP